MGLENKLKMGLGVLALAGGISYSNNLKAQEFERPYGYIEDQDPALRTAVL